MRLRNGFRVPLWLTALCLAAVMWSPAASQNQNLTPTELQKLLERNPSGAEAEQLAERLRKELGAENLKTGRAPLRLDGTLAMWAVETAEGTPRVAHIGNIRSWPLTRLGSTNVYAGVGHIPNFAVFAWQYEVAGKRFGGGSMQVEYYPPHPESLEQPGVPKGKVTRYTWRSRIFPGTVRDYWVYVPAQYQADKPAAVMVFQDGGGYLGAPCNTPTVFDNLIHKGDMPVTVGIFINPGRFEDGRSNRSFEYDTLSDQYARFLRDEILPEVGKNLNLTKDPERRAIGGASSGAICAFTVAWEMPDQFRKVLSHVGSYVNIASGPSGRAGGHNYAAVVRKTDKKPFRIFLQAGANDLDNEHGNWPLANLELAASLRWKGYDYRLDYGQGFHSTRHGAAILPDSLRWLWRDVR